jgi:aryl-alcohol dehydrogenase
LGATHVIDTRVDDVASSITNITACGVDFIVETTGDWMLHQIAVKALKPHGTLALLAAAAGTDTLPGGRKALGVIQGYAVPQQFIPKLIALYRAGEFPFDRLIRFYDFTEINKAITDAKSGETIKRVVKMSAPERAQRSAMDASDVK